MIGNEIDHFTTEELLNAARCELAEYVKAPGGDWVWADGTSAQKIAPVTAITVVPDSAESAKNPTLVAVFVPLTVAKGVLDHIVHMHNTYPALLGVIEIQARYTQLLEDTLAQKEARHD